MRSAIGAAGPVCLEARWCRRTSARHARSALAEPQGGGYPMRLAAHGRNNQLFGYQQRPLGTISWVCFRADRLLRTI